MIRIMIYWGPFWGHPIYWGTDGTARSELQVFGWDLSAFALRVGHKGGVPDLQNNRGSGAY